MSTALTELVRQSLGDPLAEIAEHREVPVRRGRGMLSTVSLRRVTGTTTGGASWSFFVKSIQSVRHLPGFGDLPAHLRDAVAADFPWRADADVYLSGRALPEGLRLPRVYRVEDLGDDRLVLWLEDVRVAAGDWDLARYAAAAGLLGELAAMHPAGGRGTDVGLRKFCAGPVANLFLPKLADPDTWRHPLLARHADPLLRADLLGLAGRIDALLAVADGLPHTLAHGDASPENLLVPADGSARFVAIDWSWPYPAVVGFDLGQLLVGRAQSGELDPGELPAVHETIESAYAEAAGADPAQVSLGYAASLVLRSAWTALPLERLEEEPGPELDELFRRRAGLARFIADLGRGL